MRITGPVSFLFVREFNISEGNHDMQVLRNLSDFIFFSLLCKNGGNSIFGMGILICGFPHVFYLAWALAFFERGEVTRIPI
jgi:hypothetical protein